MKLDWSSLFFDRSKCERKEKKKKLDFLLKVSGCLDSFPIPLDWSSLFLCCFRFLPDSSHPIKFWNSETYRNQIWIFQKFLFVYLFDSSLDSSSIFFSFLVFFVVKASKVFFIYIRQDFYTLSFSSYYMFSCIFHCFLRDFRTLGNLGFLIKIEFLFKSKPWIFVHASFKHDSHALISKFLSFIGNFEIRVLSSWEFGDFVKFVKIVWNWLLVLINWVIITCFIHVVLFNWSIKGFLRIRFFQNWEFFYNS